MHPTHNLGSTCTGVPHFLEYIPGELSISHKVNDPGNSQGRDIFKAQEIYISILKPTEYNMFDVICDPQKCYLFHEDLCIKSSQNA